MLLRAIMLSAPHRLLTLALFATLVSSSLATGQVSITTEASGWESVKVSMVEPANHFGQAVAVGGDLNGDCAPDLWISDPDNHRDALGRIWAVSGRDGSVLRAWVGEPQGEYFGSALLSLSDRNGDGHPDVLVGAPRGNRAYLCSGQSGEVLHLFDGPPEAESFGATILGVSDLDGDTEADYAIGSREILYFYSGADWRPISLGDRESVRATKAICVGDLTGDGIDELLLQRRKTSTVHEVAVLSGRDGSEVHLIRESDTNEGLGAALAGLGDVNGDGVPDFAVSSLGPERVRVHSGLDASILYECRAKKPKPRLRFGEKPRPEKYEEYFGESLASIADLDGDGVRELMIGAPESSFMQIHSGRTDHLLHKTTGSEFDFGTDLGELGDVNADGASDLWVISGPRGLPCIAGTLHIRSGLDGSLLFRIHRPAD